MPLKESVLNAIPIQYENAHEPDIDPELMPLSKCFTVLFWLTCLSVVLGSTLKFSLTKQREILQLPDSSTPEDLTFDQYMSIAHQNPICPCSNPAINIGSFTNVTPSFYPLITNLLNLVKSPNASIAYAEFPDLEVTFFEQSVAADLFATTHDAVLEAIQGLLNSVYIMNQVVSKQVVQQDLSARLFAVKTAGTSALHNSIRAIFAWASFNLPTLTFFSRYDGKNNRVYYLFNDTTTFYGVTDDGPGSFPNLGISIGQSTTRGEACFPYSRGCDLFETKLRENVQSMATPEYFGILDSLCEDSSNTTAMSLLPYPYPTNFTQWCWVAAMEKFQEQPYPADQILKKWEDIITSLTVTDMRVEVNHSVLFNSCAPVACSYSAVQYPSVGQIVSYATSLYGGVASIAGSIYAALWAFKLKHTSHKKKKNHQQEQQIAQLRETSQQVANQPTTDSP